MEGRRAGLGGSGADAFYGFVDLGGAGGARLSSRGGELQRGLECLQRAGGATPQLVSIPVRLEDGQLSGALVLSGWKAVADLWQCRADRARALADLAGRRLRLRGRDREEVDRALGAERLCGNPEPVDVYRHGDRLCGDGRSADDGPGLHPDWVSCVPGSPGEQHKDCGGGCLVCAGGQYQAQPDCPAAGRLCGFAARGRAARRLALRCWEWRCWSLPFI